jgi:hypothetical protein
MAFTNTWNANFEALPPDTGENISQGANRIRALKNALRERLEIDHYWDEAGTDADHGEHTKIRFHGNQATPANVANKSTLYPQIANSKLELWYKNDANQTVQITANGAVNAPASPIPANTVMLFYADTAPTGWTLKNTAEWNDIAVMLTKGSAAGGESGGANNANGTWTQPDHVLTVGEMPAHIHSNGVAAYAGYGYSPGGGAYIGGYNTGSNGGGNAHNHGSAWRPASKNFIACEKD